MLSRLCRLVALLLLITYVCAGADYYKILGIKRSSNAKEIKRAYRNMSKKYHPDKNPDDQEAHDRFVKVSEAYTVLSDEEKRRVYDQYGEEGLKQHEQQGGRGQHHDPFDIFSRFFGGGGHQQQRKGPNMVTDVEIDLEDTYTGKTFQLELERKEVCDHCDGSGAKSAEDIHNCPACQGHGIRIIKHMIAPGMYQQVQTHCDQCGGRGKVIRAICPHCHGARIVVARNTISVDVDRGIPEGTELVFEGEADESPDLDAGDVIVRIRSKKTPGGFTRRGENLYSRVELSVAEALLGFEKRVPHLDGHDIKISRKGVTQPGFVERIQGEGMPHYQSQGYGDLFLEYTVILPIDITTTTRAKLQDAFNYDPKKPSKHDHSEL